MDQSQLSIRAASWVAAQCVRHFCRIRGMSHPDLDAFCRHLERVATAVSVVDWDEQGAALVVTGLGDALPPPLDAMPGLNELVSAAREVTASQMYAAWTPAQVVTNLSDAAELTGLEPAKVVAAAAALHSADRQGWGLAIDEAVCDSWFRETRSVFESNS